MVHSQTDKHMDRRSRQRQGDKWCHSQTDKQVDRRRQRQGDKWCNSQTDKHKWCHWTEEDKDREINGVIHKQTDIWTEEDKDREKYTT